MEGGGNSDTMQSEADARNITESRSLTTFPYVNPKAITKWLLREILKR